MLSLVFDVWASSSVREVAPLARHKHCKCKAKSFLTSLFADSHITSLAAEVFGYKVVDAAAEAIGRTHGESTVLVQYVLVKDHSNCSAEQNNSGSLCSDSGFSWNCCLMKKPAPVLFSTDLGKLP